MDKLLEDALRAYMELGGEEYLRQHPELLERVLLYKLAKQAGASVEVDVVIDLPWLSKDRLSYKRSVEVLEQSTTPEAPGAKDSELRTLLLGLSKPDQPH